jgi:voltage-gated potassium channel
MARKMADNGKFPKRIELFIFLLAGILVVGVFGFVLIRGLSFGDALLRTIESFAFMFQESSGPAKGLEIFLSLFGVFLIWWVMWSIFDMIMAGEFGEYIKARKFLRLLKRMENHYIIAGGGRVGEELAKNLIREGKECLIIEKNADTVGKLRKKDYVVMQGDAHDESLLKQAGIMQAKAMIVTLPDPEKALVATMIAKEVNEKLDIYARCESPSFVTKLKKAGAKAVIVPEAVAADKLLEAMGKD